MTHTTKMKRALFLLLALATACAEKSQPVHMKVEVPGAITPTTDELSQVTLTIPFTVTNEGPGYAAYSVCPRFHVQYQSAGTWKVADNNACPASFSPTDDVLAPGETQEVTFRVRLGIGSTWGAPMLEGTYRITTAFRNWGPESLVGPARLTSVYSNTFVIEPAN